MSYQFPERIEAGIVHTPEFEQIYRHLQRPGSSHAMVLGRAGSGKSTLLHSLQLRLTDEGHLVLLLSLYRFRSLEELIGVIVVHVLDHVLVSRPDADPVAIERLRQLQGAAGQGSSPAVLTAVLEGASRLLPDRGRIVLLLDGLDEVRNDSVLFGQRLLEFVVTVRPEHGCMVVTSRELPYILRAGLDPRRLTVFKLGAWSRSDIEALIRRRLDLQHLALNAEQIDQAIEESKGLPLLALLLLEHAVRTGTVPSQDALGVNENTAAALTYSLAAFETEWGNPDEFWPILLACWAAKRVSLTDLARMTGLPHARVAAWVDKAEAGAYVARSGDLLSASPMLDAAVVDDLLPAPVDLDALEFGNESAELDELLPQSLRMPSEIGEILGGRKTIVLGDRGAGKSAIYRALDEHSPGERSDKVIVSTSKDPGDFLVKMGSAVGPSAERFKAIWLLYVAWLCARELQGRVDPGTARGKRFREDCHRLLRSLDRAEEVDNPSLMSRFATPLRALLPGKVSFTVGSIQIEGDYQNAGKSSSSVDINDFLEQTERVLKEIDHRFVVVFDQVDEAHKYDRPLQEQMVQGLLMAESKLAQTVALRLVVLLRTDLYEVFRIEEKNKFVSRTALLSWTSAQLAEQSLTRAYSNAQLAHVQKRLGETGLDQESRDLIRMRLLFPDVIEGREFWHWLMDALTTSNNRVAPRQIILFMNLLKKEAKGSGSTRRVPLYSEQQALAALNELSRLSYNEVIDDFKVATVLVQNCKQGKLQRLKFADVQNLCDPAEGTPAVQVDQLRRLGFFEHAVVQVGDDMVAELRVAALFRRFWT